MTDPFAEPLDIASEFPTASSFRGRLVLIQPTKVEWDLPKRDKPNETENKVTATVTVVDGLGDVQLCPSQIPSGVFIEGPVYTGVWFSQKRVVEGLVNVRTRQPLPLVLGRLETFKPGKPAKEGNPWGIIKPTEADKQMARDFLANQMKEQAAAAVAKAVAGDDDAPF